jgi:hypothetical protein
VRSELDFDSADNADIKQLKRFNYVPFHSRRAPPAPKRASTLPCRLNWSASPQGCWFGREDYEDRDHHQSKPL